MTRPSQDKRDAAAESCGCKIDIHIDSTGDVNIYNCTTPPPSKGEVPDKPASCDPIAPGQCLPVTLGAKPKQSQRQKLDTLLASSRVPSALGAGFFRHARRFLAGASPGNGLETEAFALFASMPPELQALLACATRSVDALPPADRERLLAPAILDGSGALDATTLATAFGQEIARRTKDALFDDPDAPERPGQNRFFDVPIGEESFDIQLRICSVNDLRTLNFKPPLSPGDYLPTEVQQHCTPVVVNGQPQLNCVVQHGNCPGQALTDGTCLRVPDVANGAAVVLKGVNFISVDAKVRLEARPPLTLVREVDAHVFGDLDTQLTEVINGETRTIRDCRVHDQITFRVPDDLPPGIYTIQVVMPNVSGFPNLGTQLVSNQEFIGIVPPVTARFTIASEEIVAREETSPASFGSDEVRVRVRAYPVTVSGTELVMGAEQAFDSPEFGDMDDDDRRAMVAVLFSHQAPIDGVVMTIMGHEIDSEKAYRDQINSFTDAFLHYMKIALAFVGAGVGAAALAIGLKDLLLLGLAHPIILAIAAAVLIAVVLILSAWAPADPIIADTLGFTSIDLAALTNANLPLPLASETLSIEDIKVKIVPLSKGANEYHERRDYISSAEDSKYEIVLRYNRVA